MYNVQDQNVQIADVQSVWAESESVMMFNSLREEAVIVAGVSGPDGP